MLIIILCVTFLGAFSKITSNIVVKNQELLQVYDNMKNLKNVTVTRKVVSLKKADDYVYTYDITKKWGSGMVKQESYDWNNSKDSSEMSYYFVYDNNKYYNYYNDTWVLGTSVNFLDDYDYILKFLINPNLVIKNDDGSYTIILTESLYNKYQSYCQNASREDSLFPKKIFSPTTRDSYQVKINLKISDDKYITEVVLDEMSRTVGKYSISYSNFNSSEVDIPIGILAKLYDDDK